MQEKPFRILGLQQIALGAEDKSSLTRLWVDMFGLAKVGNFESASENVREDILELGTGAATVEVDLMEPLDVEARPRVHQPALNHIGLWVDDLPKAYTWLEEQGVRFTPGGIRKGASGHDICFIHPKGNEASPIGGAGVLIELVQAPEDIIAALAG